MFPEGCEAWAEQRRTGYPRLFPVRFNHSKDGCIDTETMIRRLNFPGGLKTENAEQYAALVEALGGDDNAGTRLFRTKILRTYIYNKCTVGNPGITLIHTHTIYYYTTCFRCCRNDHTTRAHTKRICSSTLIRSMMD